MKKNLRYMKKKPKMRKNTRKKNEHMEMQGEEYDYSLSWYRIILSRSSIPVCYSPIIENATY